MRLALILILAFLAGCGDGGSSGSQLSGSSISNLSTFSPKDLSSLALWLDADDSSTLFIDPSCTSAVSIDGDSIGCWQDKSGLDRHATMVTANQKPSLRTSIHLTRALVEFDGVDDFFDNFYTYNARTAFIVFRNDTSLQQTSDLGQLWGSYSEMHIAADARSGAQERGLSFDGSGSMQGEFSYDGENFSAFAENSNSTQWSNDSFNLVTVNFDLTGTINRQVIGSLYPSFSIGTHQYGGQIAEIIVFNDLVSLSDRVKIEGYLACKWGLQGSLSAGHTYRTDCP